MYARIDNFCCVFFLINWIIKARVLHEKFISILFLLHMHIINLYNTYRKNSVVIVVESSQKINKPQ